MRFEVGKPSQDRTPNYKNSEEILTDFLLLVGLEVSAPLQLKEMTRLADGILYPPKHSTIKSNQASSRKLLESRCEKIVSWLSVAKFEP